MTAGEMERPDTTQEVTSILEQTTLGDSTPATRGNKANTRGKQPAFRGSKNIIRGGSLYTRGRQPAFRSNTNGNDLSWVPNSPADEGKEHEQQEY